jgi:cyclopropane fatty-acyl-phospholipid synthase-like methyltransferase
MRNTDNDWRIIGEKEPFFGVLSHPEYLRANLTEDSIEEFYQSGQTDIDRIVDVFEMHFGEFNPMTALDFGCGVGRLLIPISYIVKNAVGVDVSPEMLKEANKRIEKLQLNNIRLHKTIPDYKVDWVNTIIVLQHIVPVKGYMLIDNLLRILKPRGFCSLQIVFAREKRHLEEMLLDIKTCSYDGEQIKTIEFMPQIEGHMSMYDYDLNQVFWLLIRNGLHAFFLKHTNHDGCHGIIIYSRKGN